MVERALRLGMDFAVHGSSHMPYSTWLDDMADQHCLDRDFVHSCVAPVHGFPGYGSCYCLGQELLDQTPAVAINIVRSNEDICFDGMDYPLH